MVAHSGALQQLPPGHAHRPRQGTRRQRRGGSAHQRSSDVGPTFPSNQKNGNVISASKSKPDLNLEPRTTSVKEAPNLEGDLKLKKGKWWGIEWCDELKFLRTIWIFLLPLSERKFLSLNQQTKKERQAGVLGCQNLEKAIALRIFLKTNKKETRNENAM